MCLSNPLARPRYQQGSALFMAMLVLIVVGGLVLMLTRQQQLAAEQVSVEVQGTRAFWAAQAGLQLATSQLFPLNGSTSSCSLVTTTKAFTSGGLQGCAVETSCQSTPHPDQASRPLFRLKSSGGCPGGSDWQASRVVELEVY